MIVAAAVDFNEICTDVSEWGTFRDSLKAPIHGWFTYPAGFSFKAVEHSLNNQRLKKGESLIYDPFMGSGTTNIVAKCMGFNSVGIEAHPFVFNITKAKLNWDIDVLLIKHDLNRVIKEAQEISTPKNLETFLRIQFPELILKCFLPETLYDLYKIREAIKNVTDEAYKNLLNTALICTLREVSIAATGWPYIAPKKIKITSASKKGIEIFNSKVNKMLTDILFMRNSSNKIATEHQLILGDSKHSEIIKSKSVDHIFTSPPYLNNFDYADRTRLEMYFMGDAKNWGEISTKIRSKLITSATTQIARSNEKYKFNASFAKECPDVFNRLSNIVHQLSALRLIKGGKKSYDLLTIGYFNDLYEILKENFRVLKDNAEAIYILGDSAPYGVHIATDILIGEIGKNIGFKDYKIDILRNRGQKWANNPQRHSVGLRESIVTLYK